MTKNMPTATLFREDGSRPRRRSAGSTSRSLSGTSSTMSTASNMVSQAAGTCGRHAVTPCGRGRLGLTPSVGGGLAFLRSLTSPGTLSAVDTGAAATVSRDLRSLLRSLRRAAYSSSPGPPQPRGRLHRPEGHSKPLPAKQQLRSHSPKITSALEGSHKAAAAPARTSVPPLLRGDGASPGENTHSSARHPGPGVRDGDSLGERRNPTWTHTLPVRAEGPHRGGQRHGDPAPAPDRRAVLTVCVAAVMLEISGIRRCRLCSTYVVCICGGRGGTVTGDGQARPRTLQPHARGGA